MSDARKTVEVELVPDDGESTTLTVGTDETVLGAAEGTDVDLRFGCTEGRCGSCTSRLLDGAVEYENEPRALDADRRTEGFVLLCSARPTTDCRVAVGRSVLAEAFPGLYGTD